MQGIHVGRYDESKQRTSNKLCDAVVRKCREGLVEVLATDGLALLTHGPNASRTTKVRNIGTGADAGSLGMAASQ
jgi:hypothetical protein